MTGKSFRTHYDNLKVARDAPLEVIRAAYKALSQKHHPDRNPGDPKAARVLTILNAAYATLSDPEQRRLHDEWIAAQDAGDQSVTPIAAVNPPSPKTPASDTPPFRSSPPPLPAIGLSRMNIILLTIAVAIAAFIFTPYTIKNHKGVVLDSGWYFMPGGDPPIHVVLDENRIVGGVITADSIRGVIHAQINIQLLLIELAVIGLAGAALLYTARGRIVQGLASVPSAPETHGAASSGKAKNGQLWAKYVFIVVGFVGGAKALMALNSGYEAVTLEAAKAIIGIVVLVPLAYVIGWAFGRK